MFFSIHVFLLYILLKINHGFDVRPYNDLIRFYDKLCKLFWGVNIFSAPGMGRVSPKLVGQNKNAPALPPPLIFDRSLTCTSWNKVILMMRPPLWRYFCFQFHSIYSLVTLCSLQSANVIHQVSRDILVAYSSHWRMKFFNLMITYWFKHVPSKLEFS